MNLAERHAELVSRYAEANAEFMTASMAVTGKYMMLKGPSEDELNRLKAAVEGRTSLDRDMQALILEAFQSGMKFP